MGDAIARLKDLPDESIHCCITSPPYWGLRAYRGETGMIGLEETFDDHLENLLTVFREVRRVLRGDGVLWLNYGSRYSSGDTLPSRNRQQKHDPEYGNCYKGLLNCPESDCVCSGLCGECQDAIRNHHVRISDNGRQNLQSFSVSASAAQDKAHRDCSRQQPLQPDAQESTSPESLRPLQGVCSQEHNQVVSEPLSVSCSFSPDSRQSVCRGCGRDMRDTSGHLPPSGHHTSGMESSYEAYKRYLTIMYHKSKDLIDMPSMVAEVLRADGWYLRSKIPWIKRNPLPESVTDRPTSAVEYWFMLTKSRFYFYDHVAVRTPLKDSSLQRISQSTFDLQTGGEKDTGEGNRSHRKTLENFRKNVPSGWASSPRYKGQDARYPVRDKPKDSTESKFARAGSSDETNQHGIPRHRTSPKQKLHAGPYRQKRSEDPGDERDDYEKPDDAVVAGANMRNYLITPTYSYKGAHFATFSPAVVEPFIKAGTSEHGCCSECGAPWTRQVDKSESPHDGTSETQYEEGSAANRLALARQAARERGEEYLQTVETLGWKPSCECDAEVKPSVVLDCFSGSGTTGLVADRLGRDAVLIEISKEYADMAEQRIRDDAGMFAEVTVE